MTETWTTGLLEIRDVEGDWSCAVCGHPIGSKAEEIACEVLFPSRPGSVREVRDAGCFLHALCARSVAAALEDWADEREER